MDNSKSIKQHQLLGKCYFWMEPLYIWCWSILIQKLYIMPLIWLSRSNFRWVFHCVVEMLFNKYALGKLGICILIKSLILKMPKLTNLCIYNLEYDWGVEKTQDHCFTTAFEVLINSGTYQAVVHCHSSVPHIFRTYHFTTAMAVIKQWYLI